MSDPMRKLTSPPEYWNNLDFLWSDEILPDSTAPGHHGGADTADPPIAGGDFFKAAWYDVYDQFAGEFNAIGDAFGRGKNTVLDGDDKSVAGSVPLQIAVDKNPSPDPGYAPRFFFQTADNIYAGSLEATNTIESIVRFTNSPSATPGQSQFSVFGRGMDVDTKNSKLYFVVYEIENFTSHVPNHTGSTSVFDSDNNAFVPAATVTCKIKRCDYNGDNLEDFKVITRAGRVYEHIYYPAAGGFETFAFVEGYQYGDLEINNDNRDWQTDPTQSSAANWGSRSSDSSVYWIQWTNKIGTEYSIHRAVNTFWSPAGVPSELIIDDLFECWEFCLDYRTRRPGDPNFHNVDRSTIPSIYVVEPSTSHFNSDGTVTDSAAYGNRHHLSRIEAARENYPERKRVIHTYSHGNWVLIDKAPYYKGGDNPDDSVTGTRAPHELYKWNRDFIYTIGGEGRQREQQIRRIGLANSGQDNVIVGHIGSLSTMRAFNIIEAPTYGETNDTLAGGHPAKEDTFWSGAQINKARLYLQSGQFSSTVVASLANPVWQGDVGIAMSSPSGIEWDGANTLWTDSGIDFSSGESKRNLYKSSGVLTSTLKESQSVGLVNTDVYGISSLSDRSATPWAGYKVGESSKLYLQSGQFTSTLKVSLDVSSVDLKCNDVSWAGPLSAASSIPSTTGDALWSGGDGNKLYSVSGLFSSTIKDSQDVSNHDRANTGVSWDGTNTLWSGNETNRLLLMSGRFSRTVKTSLQVGAINDAPTGISTYDVDGRLSSGGASTYVGTGVIRDGLKSLTVAGTGQFSRTVPDVGQKIYITDYAATSSDALISTIDLDGFGRETVLTGPGDARDIVIDMGAKKIFWAEVSQNSVGTRTGAVHDAIFSADLGGNGKTELADIMANKRSDEVSASVVGLAIDKARERIFFMTRAVLSSPQTNPDSGATYPVRINLLVVNYDGTYNNQLGPHYFKVGNPLLRGWIDDPGRDDEMIPARMKYVEPSEGYPSGRLFYLTRTRTETEDPGYDIGGSKNRYGSEILYIDLHTDEVTTCYWHGDNIRSFDVDVENNSIYLGRHTYSPTTRVTDRNGGKHDFPGWGEEPSANYTGIRSPKARLERLDYKNNSFDATDIVSYYVHKDSYLLQDYGGVGDDLTKRIANFGNTPDPSAGNVTNQQFKDQIALAFQEWKDLFEQEFPGLTLNFQDLGVETGVPPRMDIYGPDSSDQPTPGSDDANVYDIPNGSYSGFAYDKVGDIRVAMHKFTAYSLVSGNALAHAYYPKNLLDSLGSKGSFAGDLHFDVDDNWRIDSDPISGSASTSPISILYVAAHEIGHSLGIRHDNDADSLMAPVVRSGFANDIGHLVDSQADSLAVQFLYGSDSDEPTNGSTQELPRRNQWTKLRNAIKKLQNGQSTSENITFTYSYMQARPEWVIESIDNAYYSRSPIVVLASDVWDIPSDLTLDLDNEFIYVSDYSRGQALRFDLDGSNRTALSPINIGDFSGLALLTAENNIYAGEGDFNFVGPLPGGEPPETGFVEISGDATYYAPFSSGGSDLEITKVACDGAASYKNAPRLPKLTVSAIGKFTFVGIAKAAEAALPSLGTTGQGTHTNPPSYDRPTDDIYYHNRNDSLVPHHGWNQSEFDNRYDTTVTCPRTQHAKDPFTPTDLVVNDGCDLDKDSDASVDIPVRNTSITTESSLNSSSLNASRAAKSVALMNQLNSQGLNTGRKSKLKRGKKKNEL